MTSQDGEVLGAVRVVDHGRPASRWNLVILSEGYTRADLDAGIFAQDAQNFTAAMFAAAPFDELQVQRAINVWRVDVASDERGADNPGIDPATRLCLPGTGIKVRTYFDATFCGAPTDKPRKNEFTGR